MIFFHVESKKNKAKTKTKKKIQKKMVTLMVTIVGGERNGKLEKDGQEVYTSSYNTNVRTRYVT